MDTKAILKQMMIERDKLSRAINVMSSLIGEAPARKVRMAKAIVAPKKGHKIKNHWTKDPAKRAQLMAVIHHANEVKRSKREARLAIAQQNMSAIPVQEIPEMAAES